MAEKYLDAAFRVCAITGGAGKYPAYKELLRKANEFVREPAEDPSRVMMQRAELKSALEDAEKAGGLRSRPRRPRTQEKPEKQAK